MSGSEQEQVIGLNKGRVILQNENNLVSHNPYSKKI